MGRDASTSLSMTNFPKLFLTFVSSVMLSLTTPGRVKGFWATQQAGRVFGWEEAPFRSGRKWFCDSTTARVLSESGGGRKVTPTISSGSELPPIVASSNSPHFGEAGCLRKRSVGLRPQHDSGSPAHGLAQLRVRPVLAQHHIQPHGQLARYRNFSQRAMLAHGQPPIEAA
jgi:hypothetical protein